MLFGKQLANKFGIRRESNENGNVQCDENDKFEMNKIEEMKAKAECVPYFYRPQTCLKQQFVSVFFFWFYFFCFHFYAHTIIIVNRNN